MLRRVEIRRYRHVAPGTILEFHDGMNVLLGPNAGGKTTLLELVAALSRGDLDHLGGDVDLTFELEDRGHRAIVRVETWATSFEDERGREIDVDHEEIDAEVFEPDGALVAKANFEDGVKTVTHAPDRVVTGPSPSDLWSRALKHISLEAWPEWSERPVFEQRECYRFDESLALFEAMCGREGAEPRARVHGVKGKSKYLFRSSRYVPSDLLRLFSEEFIKGRFGDVVRVSHEGLPFLRDAIAQMGLTRAAWTASLQSSDRSDGRLIFDFGRFSFSFERADGTYLTEQLLSYGQKRLLAFLYYFDATNGPIVADELVNGLHHAWVEHLLEKMRGRQAFLSTQNPLLLDYLAFESADEVRRTFVFCESKKETDGSERMAWSNLSPDDAAAFFDAYQVGIQHVSELLRTRGLW